jgi:hypothetical protein
MRYNKAKAKHKIIDYMSAADKKLFLKCLKIIWITPNYVSSYLSDEQKTIVSKAAVLIEAFGGMESLLKELEGAN